MNNIAEFEVTAAAETVIYKLARENIAVYKLKRRGGRVRFGVNTEYIEKVFAIFLHPCYNISIRRKSGRMRFAEFCSRRAGVIVGTVLFVAAAAACQRIVLNVEVTGDAGYLQPRILAIAEECGARRFAPVAAVDAPMIESRILSLSSVGFCSVQREGCCIKIDVHSAGGGEESVSYEPLVASVDGRLDRLVCVCGTPLFEEGDYVRKGDCLIGAYALDGEGKSTPCIAAGFAHIYAEACISVAFDCESDENKKSAEAAAGVYSDDVEIEYCKLRRRGDGVCYEVKFLYRVTVAANMQ